MKLLNIENFVNKNYFAQLELLRNGPRSWMLFNSVNERSTTLKPCELNIDKLKRLCDKLILNEDDLLALKEEAFRDIDWLKSNMQHGLDELDPNILSKYGADLVDAIRLERRIQKALSFCR